LRRFVGFVVRACTDPRLILELAVASACRVPYGMFLTWPEELRDKAVSFYLRGPW
jgi:hypothetical protein